MHNLTMAEKDDTAGAPLNVHHPRTWGPMARLCVLLATTSFVLFGGFATYSAYRSYTEQDAVTKLYRNLNDTISRCESTRASVFCSSITSFRNYFNNSVAERDKWSSLSKIFGITAIIAPTLLAFVFFASKWVLAGRRTV